VVIDGNPEAGTVEVKFSTTGHTGMMVPVFAYGPGAENFSGVYENTSVFYKMMSFFNFTDPWVSLTQSK